MAQQTFRTAFNGFNREDVVHYIEYLNAQHAAEITQLRAELDFLRGNAAPEAPAADESASSELIEQQAARIRELFDQCKAHEETIADLTAKLQAANGETAPKSHTDEELEAYRRAERTERMARERAEQMYRQANGIIADATVKVNEAADHIGILSQSVLSQLTQLQDAVEDSKQALCNAAATMSAIRPSDDME